MHRSNSPGQGAFKPSRQPTLPPTLPPLPVPAREVPAVDQIVQDAIIGAIDEKVAQYGGGPSNPTAANELFALAGHVLVLGPSYVANVWRGQMHSKPSKELLESIADYQKTQFQRLNALIDLGNRVILGREIEVHGHVVAGYQRVLGQVTERQNEINVQTVMTAIAVARLITCWSTFSAHAVNHLEQFQGVAQFAGMLDDNPFVRNWAARMQSVLDEHYPEVRGDHPGLPQASVHIKVLSDNLGCDADLLRYFKLCADVYELELGSTLGGVGGRKQVSPSLQQMAAAALVRLDLTNARIGDEPTDIGALLVSRGEELTKGKVKLTTFVQMYAACSDGAKPTFVENALAAWPFFAQLDRVMAITAAGRGRTDLLNAGMCVAEGLRKNGGQGVDVATAHMQKSRDPAAVLIAFDIMNVRQFYTEADANLFGNMANGIGSSRDAALQVLLSLAAATEVPDGELRDIATFLATNQPGATSKVEAVSRFPSRHESLGPWFATAQVQTSGAPAWAGAFRKAVSGHPDAAVRRGLALLEQIKPGDTLSDLCVTLNGVGPEREQLAAFLVICVDPDRSRFLGKMWAAAAAVTDGPEALIAALISGDKSPLRGELGKILAEDRGTARNAVERLVALASAK